MSTVLFVDAENIKLEEEDFMFLKHRFSISEAFLYTSPAQTPTYKKYNQALNIQIKEVMTSTGKNSVDIQIAVDILETLFSGAVERFLVASHDRDFLPVFQKLRLFNKRVIAITSKGLSVKLQPHVDDVFQLSSIDNRFRIIAKALYMRHNRGRLSLTELKKNIKTMNRRKELGEDVFKDLAAFLKESFASHFLVEEGMRGRDKTVYISYNPTGIPQEPLFPHLPADK